MKQFLSLTFTELKNTFSLSEFIYNIKNNPKKFSTYKPLWVIVLILLLLPTIYLYYIGAKYVASALASVNQESYLINMMVTSSLLLMFIFGMFYIFSALFSNKNMESLLALPLKPSTIVSSKVVQSVIFEYILVVFVGIPVIAGYASHVGAGVLYWLYSIIVLLVMPVFPISLSAIILILLLKFINLKGGAEKIQTVVTSIFLILIVVFNYYATNMSMTGSEEDFLVSLLKNSTYLIDSANRFLPIAGFATKAIVQYNSLSGLFNLLLFVLLSGIFFLLCMFVGEKYYLLAVTKQGAKKEKALSRDELKKAAARTSSPIMAIFKADVITLLKTPIFFINCVLIIPIVPFLLFVPLIAGGEEITQMLSSLYAASPELITLLFAIGIAFVISMVSIPSSTFSRDGSAFWITQVTPVTPTEQMIGRLLSSFAFGLVDIVGIMLFAVIVVKVSFLSAVLIILLSLALLAFSLCVGLIIDVTHPVLKWENPAVAVKQNFNVVFNMLILLVLLGGIGFLGYLLIGLGEIFMSASIIVISILGILLCWWIFKKAYNKAILQ